MNRQRANRPADWVRGAASAALIVGLLVRAPTAAAQSEPALAEPGPGQAASTAASAPAEPPPAFTGELRGHLGPVLMSLFAPDGRQAITVSTDHTARIWN